jgi:hypothetical protein
LTDYVQQCATHIQFPSSGSWVILSPIEQRIKEKIEKVGIPLKDWDISINYGIKTGCNDAFIIDKGKRDELIEKDANSAEIIRPILRGRDIKRYGYEFADLYLLFIPWHFPLHLDTTITGASKEAELKFKKEYPAVYNHLLQYKDMLSARNTAETGIRYEWYALQRWGANYWEDFFKRKIIFQEIVQEPSFMFDIDGSFFCLDTARIITGNNIDYLIAILNSRLFFFAIKHFYGGGGLGDKGVRMKHTFFEDFSCPIPDLRQRPHIYSLLNSRLNNNDRINDKLENEINNNIYSLYKLSNEEIEFIEAHVK